MCRRRAWVLSCLVLLLVLGCGPRFANVSGTVKYQGQPMTGGTITFFDTANGVASSPIMPDGTYSVSRVAAGRARIAVIAPMAIAFKGLGESKPALPGGAPPPTLPVKYSDPEQSGLSCEVASANQTHHVSMD